jgi:hypothetical protein
MANRSFVDRSYSLLKGEVRIYLAATAAEAASPTLLKYNYPQMGMGSTAPGRTYTAAPTTGGGFGFATRYAQGAEGVFSVVRTAVGLWTVTFSDAYQRLVDVHGFISVAGGAPNVVAIHENTTITNLNSTNAAGIGQPFSVVGVSFLSATAALVDPTTASRVQLCFTFQNNTEP